MTLLSNPDRFVRQITSSSTSQRAWGGLVQEVLSSAHPQQICLNPGDKKRAREVRAVEN